MRLPSLAPPDSPTLPLGVLLGLLVVLSGCTVGPFGGSSGQEGPVTVIANNSANATHTFEVYVIKAPPKEPSFTIRNRRGEVDTITTEGRTLTHDLYMHDDKSRNFVSAEFPPNKTRLHGRYELQPTEERQTNITDFESDDTIVMLIWNDNEITSIIAVSCSDDLVVVIGSINPYGGSVGANCELPPIF